MSGTEYEEEYDSGPMRDQKPDASHQGGEGAEGEVNEDAEALGVAQAKHLIKVFHDVTPRVVQ